MVSDWSEFWKANKCWRSKLKIKKTTKSRRGLDRKYEGLYQIQEDYWPEDQEPNPLPWHEHHFHITTKSILFYPLVIKSNLLKFWLSAQQTEKWQIAVIFGNPLFLCLQLCLGYNSVKQCRVCTENYESCRSIPTENVHHNPNKVWSWLDVHF